MSPPDVRVVPAMIPDAAALFEHLVTTIAWDTRMRARLTATFGVPYNYSGMTYPAIPMLPAISTVVAHIASHIGFEPNNCLANYYPTGESTMGFHADSVVELVPGTGVAVVSLGAERTLRFRRIDDPRIVHDYPLAAGSLLYMPPEVQAHWKHGVPAQPGTGPRISLTFRQVRPDLLADPQAA